MLTTFFRPMICHAATTLLRHFELAILEKNDFLRSGSKKIPRHGHAISSDMPGLLGYVRGGPFLADEIEIIIGDDISIRSTNDIILFLKYLQEFSDKIIVKKTDYRQRFRIITPNLSELLIIVSRSYVIRSGGIYVQFVIGSFSNFSPDDFEVFDRIDDKNDWIFDECEEFWRGRFLEEDPAFNQDVVMPGEGFPGLCLVRTPVRFWTPWRARDDLESSPAWTVFETLRQFNSIQAWHRTHDISFDRREEPFKYDPLSLLRLSRWDDMSNDEGKALFVTPSWSERKVLGLLVVSKSDRRLAGRSGGKMAFRRYLVQVGENKDSLLSGWRKFGLTINSINER